MQGRDVEQHPAGYEWSARFPEYERLLAGEGWVMFTARGEGAWWLVFDEGTLADFLDPVEDAALLATLVRLERFDDRRAWEAAVVDLRRRGVATRRMVKYLPEDG